ncbi:unnamed protein product [Nippostrongylus brasiliensis]|uniref:Uncharacterized protein n=1 Tax=Nippostrongylus brasiliensis TaxID=27835 RepID=A0A0N4YM36_NIPBR|nr:unnamed protein product [Nippostrongylus brasiliensis]
MRTLNNAENAGRIQYRDEPAARQIGYNDDIPVEIYGNPQNNKYKFMPSTLHRIIF